MAMSRRDVFQRLPGALAAPWLLSRAEAEVTPDLVQFRPEIEPLVALIERTPRDRCAEMIVDQLKRGVSYRQLMAAVFLAGIRNVNPRPPGFALHCVFVIHSAHLLGLEAPADSRLLPLFYALDTFKASQERDAGQASGDYTMRPVKGKLPSPLGAAAELSAAMDAWDGERAERAVAALARHRSAPDVFEMLWRYGARDYRNIGHKAIYVANAYRTLHAIGWQHAEPVLRSIVLALIDFGPKQQVNGYAYDDQCYLANVRRLNENFPKLTGAWVSGEPNAEATRAILAAIRDSNPDQACANVTERMVNNKLGAGAVWDAVHLAAAELRMRANKAAALGSIHAVTSANGLHHAFLSSTDPETRFLVLLQAVGWMTQFRNFSQARPENLRTFTIASLEPAAEAPVDRTLEEIFAAIPSGASEIAPRAFRLAADLKSRHALMSNAARLTISKANEVHYYKYLAALIEDIDLVNPEWQPHLVAASLYYVKGASDPEPPAMKRAREVLKALPV